MSVVALLVLLLGWLSGARAAQPARMTLAEADRHFAQKSYAAALQGYQAALQAGAVPAGRREEIAYRVAVALGKTKQWDRALETTLTFVKQHRETVWEPRAL